MDATSMREAVKRRFRITSTALDSDINDCVEASVDSLAPYIKQATVDTSLSLTTDQDSFTLPVAGADLEKVYVQGSNDLWTKYDQYTVFGDNVYLKSWLASASSVRLFLKVPFTLATIADIPLSHKRPLFDLASAEFSTMLAGDKTRYNIYAQSNGARAVDNMLDLASYYEEKARRSLVMLSQGEAVG